MRLFHHSFQWSIIILRQIFFLGGRISDGNGGSLEALFRGDDDKRDDGFQVCAKVSLLDLQWEQKDEIFGAIG